MMFESLNSLLDTVFNEFRSLGITIFAIGILVMALLTAFGGEENIRTFKSGFVLCVVGCIVFFLAKPLISFIQNSL